MGGPDADISPSDSPSYNTWPHLERLRQSQSQSPLFPACQPDRAPPALRIVADVFDHLKACLIQQSSILFRIEASVIERLALELPQNRTMLRSAGEHQRSPGPDMLGEHRKHPLLILRGQMKEAMPRYDAVKSPPKIERAHVCHDPILIRKSLAAKFDQRRRGIDAGHVPALADPIAGDRQPRAATKIEDRPARRNQREEAIQPRLLEKTPGAPQPIPGGSMPLVKADNPVRVGVHRGTLPEICPAPHPDRPHCRLLFHPRQPAILNLP